MDVVRESSSLGTQSGRVSGSESHATGEQWLRRVRAGQALGRKSSNVSKLGSQFLFERLPLAQPAPAAISREAEQRSAEWVDNLKAIYHLPMGQVFGVDPVAAEGQRSGDDCAVPK